MARIMSVDQVDIYRMLVTRQRADGRQYQTAYGPHDASGMARDWDAKGFLGALPARREKQKLAATDYMTLKWVTIKTTYTNGGEEVEWNA